MLLKSPLLKIVGTSKKDCAFIRNYGAKIGDIVQFEYNPCDYRPEVIFSFLNKGCIRRKINSVNLRSFDSFIETEIVTDSDKPETQAESFEL